MKKVYFEFAGISFLWLAMPALINLMQSKKYFEMSESSLVIAGYIFAGLVSLLVHLGLNARHERLYQYKRNVSWRKIALAFIVYLFLVVGLIIMSPQTQLKTPYLIKIVITNIAVIGLIEELIFRGILLNKALILWKNKYAAFLTVSTVFSGAHILFMIANDVSTPTLIFIKLISSFALSLFLCWAYLKSKSLLLCIIFHAGQNIIANLAFINPTIGLIFFALGYVLIFITIKKSNKVIKQKQVSANKKRIAGGYHENIH